MEIKKVEKQPLQIHTKESMTIHQADHKEPSKTNISLSDSGSKNMSVLNDRADSGIRTMAQAKISQELQGVKEIAEMGADTAANQIEGGNELKEAASTAKTIGEPVMRLADHGIGAAHSSIRLADRKIRARRMKRIESKKVVKKASRDVTKQMTKETAKQTIKQSGKYVVKHGAKETVKETSKETTKTVATEAAKVTAEVAVEVGTEAAGTAAGSSVGPLGTVIGLAAGVAIGQQVGNIMEVTDMRQSTRIRKMKYFHDKMQAEDERKDSLLKVIRDNLIRRVITAFKVADPTIKLTLVSMFLIFWIVTIPVTLIVCALYNEGEGSVSYQGSLTETEIAAIVENLPEGAEKQACIYALSKVGYPYDQSRRDSGEAYDCSSLVHWAWDSAGVDITYQGMSTAAMEAKGLHEQGQEISFDELQAGDLIFWAWSDSPGGGYLSIDHVAIYIDDGYMVEAANEKVGVVYRQIYSKGNIVMIGRPKTEDE